MKGQYPSVGLRPCQLLCTVCAIGEDIGWPKDTTVRKFLDAVHENPDVPVTLRCNAKDVYVYQDPGTGDDTPTSPEFNRKRDLDILQRLDLAPGSTLPARTLFHRLLRTIPTVAGICGYEAATAEAWGGCPKAKSGFYEKGHKKGIDAIIPPRAKDEKASEKKRSVAAMREADEITIRPHILMCLVCIVGGKGTLDAEPLTDDNLIELLDIARKKPDTRIKLVQGADWMVCGPCSKRVPKLNACVNVNGSGGLSNELRDLNMLRLLGLTYGASLKAPDMFRLILERIPTTVPVCTKVSPEHSVWWDPCSAREKGSENYVKGRAMLLKAFA